MTGKQNAVLWMGLILIAADNLTGANGQALRKVLFSGGGSSGTVPGLSPGSLAPAGGGSPFRVPGSGKCPAGYTRVGNVCQPNASQPVLM